MSKKKNRKKQNNPPQKPPEIHTDVLGSYTGMAEDGSAPVQDADDL